MSALVLAAEGGEAGGGEGFVAPGPAEFEYPPIFGDGTFFTKPMLIVVLGSVFIAVVFYLAACRAARCLLLLQWKQGHMSSLKSPLHHHSKIVMPCWQQLKNIINRPVLFVRDDGTGRFRELRMLLIREK